MGYWSAALTDNHGPKIRMNTGLRPATRHRSNGEKRGFWRGSLQKTPAPSASGTQQDGHNPRQHWRLWQKRKKPARGWLLQSGGAEFTTKPLAIGANEHHRVLLRPIVPSNQSMHMCHGLVPQSSDSVSQLPRPVLRPPLQTKNYRAASHL